MRNIIYYGDWSVWEGEDECFPRMLAGDQLTHLNFAFLDFDANGNLQFTDTDAELGHDFGLPDVEWGAANSGILNGFQDLRASNPNLKVGVSIGGWSKSGDFAPMAASDTARANFVTSVVKFVKYLNFDFVDIDWEYPNYLRDPDLVDNQLDEGTTKAGPADKANFLKLIQDLRKALDAQGEQLGKKYELSVCLPADPVKMENGLDIVEVFKYIDFGNVMTYDLYGEWSNISGHHAALYTNPLNPDPDQFSADKIITHLLGLGIQADKITIGVAFYSRGWGKIVDNNVDPKNPGLFGTAELSGKDSDGAATFGAPNELACVVGDGGRLGGSWSYRKYSELKSKYALTEYWDDVAKAPYMYNAATGMFFTYDNAQSIEEKAKYVKEKGLGGIITWMASQDAPTGGGKVRNELQKVIKNALFGSEPLPALEISPAPIDVSITVTASKTGYNFKITNNAKKDETQTVLKLVEAAGETIKLPKLYVHTKSKSTFEAGDNGVGTVTNVNGVGIIDLGAEYEYQLIKQGGSKSVGVKVTGTISLDDIESIEISQRMASDGPEISRQTIKL